MANISVRIPDDLDSTLEMAAKKLERSKSFLIRKALEEYLSDSKSDKKKPSKSKKKN